MRTRERAGREGGKGVLFFQLGNGESPAGERDDTPVDYNFFFVSLELGKFFISRDDVFFSSVPSILWSYSF